MILQELFDNGAVPWKWTFIGDEDAIAEFEVNKHKYEFKAFAISTKSNWEVEFQLLGVKGYKNKFGINGVGNSQVVMATIVDILKNLLDRYHDKIDKLSFSAEGLSRQSLYKRMIQRLIPHWILSINFTPGIENDLTFTLSNPNYKP